MVRSEIEYDTNPFFIMCSVIAAHVVASACLLMDLMHP
jgi:hypothetical protein